MDDQRRVTKLMEKGFSCLDACRYTEALKVGRELKKLRHSSAFEILALAYLRSDKLSQAIRVLEEGVAKAGRVWILWELLGNCYSYARRFAKAEKAYQRALQLETCDRDVVHLNRAIAFNRSRKRTEAKSALRLVKSPRLHRRTDACRIRTALKLGDSRSARQLALHLSRSRPVRQENYDCESESEILLTCALALKTGRDTKGKALRLAFRAVEVQPSNVEALALIREISRRKTAHPLLFRLLLKGVWQCPIDKLREPPGFFRTVEIVAGTESAALQYAKLFFPRGVRESLSIEEGKTLNVNASSLEGVYFLSGYMFYRRRRDRRP